jgi:transcriptional regulator with XRE-family HTH domain
VEPIQIGGRIRAARTHRAISMRTLAKAVGISQSALSQIETGKAQPSVQTLYKLVRELSVSFDELVGIDNGSARDNRPVRVLDDAQIDFVPVSQQKRIDLDTGVSWHRLSHHTVAGANFLRIVHPAGSRSAPAGTHASHAGFEFVYVISGTLQIEIGFDSRHVLHPGDAVSFPGITPHRVSNPGTAPAEIICVILERSPDDK